MWFVWGWRATTLVMQGKLLITVFVSSKVNTVTLITYTSDESLFYFVPLALEVPIDKAIGFLFLSELTTNSFNSFAQQISVSFSSQMKMLECWDFRDKISLNWSSTFFLSDLFSFMNWSFSSILQSFPERCSFPFFKVLSSLLFLALSAWKDSNIAISIIRLYLI